MRALLPVLVAAVLTNAAIAAEPTSAVKPRIKFGIQTGQQDVTYEQVLAIWKEAETLGFDSAWNFDHLIPIRGDRDGPCLEAWTMLGALAAETSRIRIGSLVNGNTYRNPALVAKMATTLDQISGGRFELGLGAAWFEPEHQAYGFHFGSAKERAERLDEALQVITKLWGEDHPSFQGRYYSLYQAPFAPKNIQQPHPPIVIGGQGKKWIMPLVGRYADAWNVPIGITPKGILSRREIIRDECARAGRKDCADIEIQAFLVLYSITDVPFAGGILRMGARIIEDKRVAQSILAGTPQQITDHIQHYVDAGVTHVIMNIQPPYDPALLKRFASEVMPNFR